MILALGYQSRTGKDTLAGMIEDELLRAWVDVRRVSFAAALKSAAHEAFVHYGLRGAAFYDTAAGAALRTVPLPGINRTPVELWIAFGEACKVICPSVWCDRVMDVIDQNSPSVWWVISDLRFPMEAEAVRARRGATVLVERAGNPVHGSDTALGSWEWDWHVKNDGTLRDLKLHAQAIVSHFRGRA